MQEVAEADEEGLRYRSRSSSSPHWVGRGGGDVGSDSGESTSGRSIPPASSREPPAPD